MTSAVVVPRYMFLHSGEDHGGNFLKCLQNRSVNSQFIKNEGEENHKVFCFSTTPDLNDGRTRCLC